MNRVLLSGLAIGGVTALMVLGSMSPVFANHLNHFANNGWAVVSNPETCPEETREHVCVARDRDGDGICDTNPRVVLLRGETFPPVRASCLVEGRG